MGSVFAGDDALQHEVLGDVLWYVILQVVGALKGSGCPLFHVGELQSLWLDPQTDDVVGSFVKGFVWGEDLDLVVSQLEEGVLQQFLHCVSVREGQEAWSVGPDRIIDSLHTVYLHVCTCTHTKPACTYMHT